MADPAQSGVMSSLELFGQNGRVVNTGDDVREGPKRAAARPAKARMLVV